MYIYHESRFCRSRHDNWKSAKRSIDVAGTAVLILAASNDLGLEKLQVQVDGRTIEQYDYSMRRPRQGVGKSYSSRPTGSFRSM